MTNRTGLRRALGELGELGELLESHRGDGVDLDAFEPYADDPVGFLQDVLEAEPWRLQREIAEAVRDEPLVTVRSCHAAGKDWLAARLALWWVYARRGLVILTGPTATQVQEILMRKEVRDAFNRARLPGSLHVNALRPGGEGQAGILAKTATGVSALTGFHDARVLFVITEAQDPDIDHAWDAAFAVATGAEDRILTLGNPVEQAGRFYQAHRPGSEWRAMKIAASDIPNVQEGKTVVPGLLTQEGVNRFAAEYGEDSGFYQSRVFAEFPAQSEEGIFRQKWLEAAASQWESVAAEHGVQVGEPIVAVDPARYGSDQTAVAVTVGRVLKRLTTWSGIDTMETVERVRAVLSEAGVSPAREPDRRRRPPEPGSRLGRWQPARGLVVVDEVGVGAGVVDRLSEIGYRTEGFSGGKAASHLESQERFANLRAQAFWTLRQLLEARKVAMPQEGDLWRELMLIRWRPTPSGKIQIEAKEDLRSRLGRSPDSADAVAMAFHAWKLQQEFSYDPADWAVRHP